MATIPTGDPSESGSSFMPELQDYLEATDGIASGIGSTSTDGFSLVNNTAAAAGAQQWSPRLRWTGQGWKTNATAGSQTVDMIAELVPVQGAANPSSFLAFRSQINAGGFTNVLALNSNGYVGFGINTALRQAHIFGAGQAAAALTDAGNKGGTIYLQDSGSLPNNGGALLFGASQGYFAAIKGLLADGSNNTFGRLAISMRTLSTDTALTEYLSIDRLGNVALGPTAASYRLDAIGSMRLRYTGVINPGTAGQSLFFSDSTPTNIAEIQSFDFDGTFYGLKLKAWNGSGLADIMVVKGDGKVGIGTGTTVSARLHVISTTVQARLGYDAANFVDLTVGAAGDLTIAPAGGDTSITGNLSISSLTSGRVPIVSLSGLLIDDGDLTFLTDTLTATKFAATMSVSTPSLIAAANLTAEPVGDWIFNAGGKDILPFINYDQNLGAPSKKYLTLHAAELWVETLVAQDTIATIGGRILVGPTTVLTSDLAAAATSIIVKHNEMASGDRVYMEANGKVEFMAITSGPSGGGPYTYTVTRNLDGTGANDWFAGDAVFNTGTTGDGFIDLYSVHGVKSASQFGPTIVGNIRTGTTYNAWAEHWAIGNLNGLYGYSSTTYGVGLGEYLAGQTHITIDTTNGYRTFVGLSTVVQQIDNSGNITVGVVAASTSNILLSASGSVSIRNNTTVLAQWAATGDITIGEVAASKANTLISAGALSIRLNTTTLFNVDTSGNVTIGVVAASSGNILLAASGAISIRNNTTNRIHMTAAGVLSLNDSAGTAKITLDASAGMTLDGKLQMLGASSAIAIGVTPPTSATAGDGLWVDRTGLFGVQASAQTFSLAAATGVFKLGSDLSSAANTAFVLAGTAVTYNSEALGAGDILIGCNSGSKANIHWKKSTGQLEFRGGTSVQAYVDTDGSIKAGGGNVLLTSAGLKVLGTGKMLLQSSDLAGVTSYSLSNASGGIVTYTQDLTTAGSSSDSKMLFKTNDQDLSYAYFQIFAQPVGFGGDDLRFWGDATVAGMTIGANAAPNAMLDVRGNTIIISTARTPASASAAGVAGSVCWDSSFVYICVASSQWKRVAIATW